MLGKMEETVLLALVRTRGDALPSAIYATVVETTPEGVKEPAFAAVYTTINRMAAKKLVTVGKTIDEKGRDRRTFSISASGEQALRGNLSQTYALGGFAFGRG